jgi:hypothetical protein
MSYSVTLINKTDGTVDGHKAGCADIKRGKNHADTPWTFDVGTKRDAFLEYNADFIDEADGDRYAATYAINWLPCANHVPADEQTVADGTEVEDGIAPQPTVKVGRKWITITAADGSLIAEVRNDQVEAVLALLAR